MNGMNLEKLWRRNMRPTDKRWLVRIKDTKGLDMYFKSRKEARDYKRLLKKSSRMLEAEIVRKESDDIYLLEEKVES